MFLFEIIYKKEDNSCYLTQVISTSEESALQTLKDNYMGSDFHILKVTELKEENTHIVYLNQINEDIYRQLKRCGYDR